MVGTVTHFQINQSQLPTSKAKQSPIKMKSSDSSDNISSESEESEYGLDVMRSELANEIWTLPSRIKHVIDSHLAANEKSLKNHIEEVRRDIIDRVETIQTEILREIDTIKANTKRYVQA